MIVYSIKDLEKLSGVKAHTLRIWEKRYGIIEPKRTETNIRYYLDEDVQKILNIALLNKKGYKISKISKMTTDEIKTKVAEISEVDAQFEDQVDGLILSMLELDEAKFNRIIDHNIEQRGFEEAMEVVIYPLLDKLSMMWIAGSVKSVHENFVSAIIRRKMIVCIDQLSSKVQRSDKIIIYLPEGETHELSLLYLHFVLKKRGFEVLNLGTHVPLIDVVEGHLIFKASYIFTIFNDSFSETPLQPYLDQMKNNLGSAKIIISGYQTISQNLTLNNQITVLHGLKEIRSFLANM